MLKRTHLALGFGIALYFLPHVKNKFIFFPIVLLASILPNVDSIFVHGRHPALKSLKSVFTPRGVLHTYTTCIIISIFFAFFYPVVALPFFLGYSFHLTLDAFTPEGVVPFWPLKKRTKGKVHTGGKVDRTIFYVLLFVDLALLLKLFLP